MLWGHANTNASCNLCPPPLSLLLPIPLAQYLLQVKGPATSGGGGGVWHREAIARPPNTAEPLNKPHPPQPSRQTAPLSVACFYYCKVPGKSQEALSR